MKKISQIEKNTILEMHSKLKKPLISEQAVGDPKSKLNKMLEDGCVKNGKIVELQSKNPILQFAIKQESTKTPGKFRYFFADNRVGSFDGNGKFEFSPSKWSCNAVQQATLNASTVAQQASNTEDINRIKTEGGWKEASEIKTTRENLENPKMFEKKVVNGVVLYRSVISSGITGGLTDEQTKIIKKYTDLGGKLRKDLDAEEAQTWTSKVVYPAGTLFSQDLVMYFPPSIALDVKNEDGNNIEKQFNNAITNQTPTSKSDCKNTVEAYYKAWKTKKRVEPNTFIPMKEKVQACVNEFDGKWGGMFSSIDNYIETLRGGSGGPLSYGEDSKWRLK
jgi:hypothetical protein